MTMTETSTQAIVAVQLKRPPTVVAQEVQLEVKRKK
jgi:hypothetical protein